MSHAIRKQKSMNFSFLLDPRFRGDDKVPFVTVIHDAAPMLSVSLLHNFYVTLLPFTCHSRVGGNPGVAL